MSYQQTIFVDFDGTIRSEGASGTPPVGEPMPGVSNALAALRKRGFRVIVFSCAGRERVRDYLIEHGIVVDDICTEKPNGIAYIDDKAVAFRGDWAAALRDLERLRQWRGE